MQRTNNHGETFGAWLLAQNDRERLVGEPVAALNADRRFIKEANTDDVRQHLLLMQTEDHLLTAVNAAEYDCLAGR